MRFCELLLVRELIFSESVYAQGTQIQATMFNEAAKKFYPIFELGKVYYVSKGSLRIANKQFKTVQNDYEMSLNENAIVEEAEGETFIPQVQYNFVKIDHLGTYVGGRELVGTSELLELSWFCFFWLDVVSHCFMYYFRYYRCGSECISHTQR